MGLFHKKTNGGLRTYFFEPPGSFGFFTLPLEISDKKLHAHPGNSINLSIRSLGNSKAKNQDPALEIPRAISLIPLEIQYPQPPPPHYFFSGIPAHGDFNSS